MDILLTTVIIILAVWFFSHRSKANELRKKADDKKAKYYDKNVGHRLVDEFNECKTIAEYKVWENLNIGNFDIVKNYVILEITKKQSKSLISIAKIDNRIEMLQHTIHEEKSIAKDIMKRYPFVKTLKNIQNRRR